MSTTLAADRGGPVVHGHGESRSWMRAAAPGIAFRHCTDESSPIGGGASRGSIPSNGTAGGNGSTWRTRHDTRPTGAPRTDEIPADEPSATTGTDPIRQRRRVVIFCIILLAGLGLASAGQGLYILAKAQVAQVLLHSAWERTRVSGVAAKPWPWADTHPVARLIVPERNADLLVLAGASGRSLAFGPGHLDGSAQPGEPGNAVLTAHRDTHFRFLRNVGAGDNIVVERSDRSLRQFRVREAYVADHRALRLPRDTDVPTLTLVTCFPFDTLDPGGPLRYIVVAEAVDSLAPPLADATPGARNHWFDARIGNRPVARML